MSLYVLEKRYRKFLNVLLDADTYYTVHDLMDKSGLGRRTVYYNIKKINDWLNSAGLNDIRVERNKGIFLENEVKKEIRKALRECVGEVTYVFTPKERVKIIIVTIILSRKKLTLVDFENVCQVSRNTIINDLKEVKKSFNEVGLDLEVNNKKGYTVKGDALKKRTLFFLHFYYIFNYYQRDIIHLDDIKRIDSIFLKLQNIELELNADYVRGVIFSIAVYFAHITWDKEEIHFSEAEKKEIMNTEVFEMVKKAFNDYRDSDQIYLTLHLLGSRLQSSVQLSLDNEDEVLDIAENLVREFSRISNLEFDNAEELVQALSHHLSTSIYRYRYGVQLANPLLADIKEEYEYLFEVTKRACEYLKKRLGVPIPESEIGYITLHFGGALRSKCRAFRIMIVCPNGVSISSMLKSEVTSLVPFINEISCISLNEYKVDHDYQLVISTVDISDDEHDILLVQPILNDDDRFQIMRRCMKYMGNGNFDLNVIFRIAKRYISDEDFGVFKTKVLESLSHGYTSALKTPKDGHSMLDYLSAESIDIYRMKVDWKVAVNLACNYLLKGGFVDYRYVESIITSSESLNHYMFITPEVYLAHTKCEDGALKLGVALSVFKKPVEFDNNKQARIIIALSTPDKEKHIKILGEIMRVFSDPQCVRNIIECNRKSEIMKILIQKIKGGI